MHRAFTTRSLAQVARDAKRGESNAMRNDLHVAAVTDMECLAFTPCPDRKDALIASGKGPATAGAAGLEQSSSYDRHRIRPPYGRYRPSQCMSRYCMFGIGFHDELIDGLSQRTA